MRSPLRHAIPLLAAVAAVSLATPVAEAQVCEGDIRLQTQAEVDAFDCTEVTGVLIVRGPSNGTSDIENLDGLAGLTSVGGRFEISSNAYLSNLNGLEDLTIAENDLRIYVNDGLASLDGLSNLTTVGGWLYISHNASLLNLEGLSGLVSVGETVVISDNPSLTDLTGLSNLTSVGLNFLISRNPSLTSINGLAETISGGIFQISENSALTHLNALPEVLGFFISENPSLTHIEIPPGGYVTAHNNDALTSLAASSSIASLEIEGNDALLHLDGLAEVSTIGGDLLIQNNASLANVDGLAGLTSIGSDLGVWENPSLGECTVGLGELLTNEGVSGIVDIRDNAPGCNSIWEAMGGNVDDEDEAMPLVTGLAAAYPNPSSGATTLTYTLAEPGEVRLTIYDALGRRVRTLAAGPAASGEHEVTLDTRLPAGVYVVRFEADGKTWTERMTIVR